VFIESEKNSTNPILDNFSLFNKTTVPLFYCCLWSNFEWIYLFLKMSCFFLFRVRMKSWKLIIEMSILIWDNSWREQLPKGSKPWKIGKTSCFFCSQRTFFFLLSSDLDAFLYDAVVLDYLSGQDDGCRLRVVGNWYAMTGYGLGFPKQSKFKDMINKELIDMQHSGEIERLRRFWFTG